MYERGSRETEGEKTTGAREEEGVAGTTDARGRWNAFLIPLHISLFLVT